MIRTAEEASRASHLLQGFKALAANEAWSKEIAPALAKAAEEHRDGCTALGKTPVERAEHVRAFHLATDLAGLVERRIESLTADLRAYQRAGE